MSALTFLHPGLLAALGAVCAPLVIHWIGRRQAPVIYFAAFDFLQAVNQRTAARQSLQQWLLLALRSLVILALVLAVARPNPQRPPPPGQSQTRCVALIVDTSGSMAFVQQGVSLVEQAVARAQEMLTHLAPGDRVTAMATGPGYRALLAAPTRDHGAVRAALQQLRGKAPQGVADMGQALSQAVQQLARAAADAQASGTETQSPSQDLFIFSDLAANSFAHLQAWAPTAIGGAAPPKVHLVDAAPPAGPRSNTAVQSVDIDTGAAPAHSLERALRVRLHNFGPTAVVQRPITLCVDDVAVVRALVDVGPDSSVDKVLTHRFAAPGRYRFVVRLGPSAADGYSDDDVYYGQLHLGAALRVLAIDGEPRATAYDDELYFVQRALEAVPKNEPGILVHTLPITQLAEGLDAAEPPDVCILAHPAHLDDAAAERLLDFVAQGGGLLVTMGSHVHFETLNKQLGQLLPYALRDLRQAADPGTQAASLGIASFDWTHPILQELGAGAEESLRHSRTMRYFNLDTGALSHARALLRFDNGAPALIEARQPAAAGAGRVLLLTTSIDVDLTDLPLRTAFVPLVQRSVRYLADSLAQTSQPPRRAGQTYRLQLPTGACQLRLVSPSGRRLEAQQAADPGDAVALQVGPLDEVGVWQASVGRHDTLTRAQQLDVAVNPRLDESDFTPIAAAAVRQSLEGHSAVGARVAQRTGFDSWQTDDTAHLWSLYLLLAVAGLVAAESLLAARN